MKRFPTPRSAFAVGCALVGTMVVAGCGGGSGPLALGNKSSTTVAGAAGGEASGPGGAVSYKIGTTSLDPTAPGGSGVPAEAGTLPSSTTPASPPGTLPANANATYPYGSVDSGGLTTALPPPNASYVNEAKVRAAPSVGPFKIDPDAGSKSWPDACALTSLAQLEALDPQITGLAGPPVGQPAASGENTPHNGGCRFDVTTSFTPASKVSAGAPSSVEIRFAEIDSDAPRAFEQDDQDGKEQTAQFPGTWADYPNLPGGTHCFYAGDDGALKCLTGKVEYQVLGQRITPDQADVPDSANQVRWITEIELPLAEKLGTELQS